MDEKNHEAAFLEKEADHYYQAEMQHEQRANWVLGFSIAILALSFHDFFANSAEASKITWFLLNVSQLFGVLTCALAILAIWPLAGGSGVNGPRLLKLKEPRNVALPSEGNQGGNTISILRKHLGAHRARAMTRASQLTCALASFATFGALICLTYVLALMVRCY